jgi:hypothetical protein
MSSLLQRSAKRGGSYDIILSRSIKLTIFHQVEDETRNGPSGTEKYYHIIIHLMQL